MRHLLYNSCVLKSKIWNAFVRGIASEPVVQNFEGSDKTSTLGQRWQQHENQVLIAGIEKQELENEKVGEWNSEQTRKEKWEEIETYCHLNGINRSAEQCRQRWQRLVHAFSKIKSWENCRPPGKSSFWSMKASEKKAEGLSLSLDLETFKAMDVIQSKKGLTCATTGFSSAEAVSTESPSFEAKFQQQKIDDSETQLCTEGTFTSIGSDQEAKTSNQDLITVSLKSTQQTNRIHDDDRPKVFVNAINECLEYLKDFVYDSRHPERGQVDIGSGAHHALYKNAENLNDLHCYNKPLKDRAVSPMNAAGEPAESIQNEVPCERKNQKP